MNLIVKTSLYYVGSLIVGLFIGGFIFYHLVHTIIDNKAIEDLKTEEKLVEEQVLSSENVPDFTPYFGHQILVTLHDYPIKAAYAVHDTTIIDAVSEKEIQFRYLIASDNKNNKSFTIEIFKPLIGPNQLIRDIFIVMFLVFLFLLFSLVGINYLISRRTWSGFYNTLKRIKDYDIDADTPLTLTKTNITEFMQLNDVLTQMSNKIFSNYKNLKEFTENASHEIQTPLAIIKTKLELLIQGQLLTEEQMTIIQTIYDAVTRLSKLNANLVLLTKIENNQFADMQHVNINKLIDSILANFDDIIMQKQLFVNKDFQVSDVKIAMNPALAEVLILNLISNAVKHNIESGFINITTWAGGILISNSGLPLEIDPQHMFNRFKKSKHSSESLGLGLSIVQKIVLRYNLSIKYSYQEGVHTLELKMKNDY